MRRLKRRGINETLSAQVVRSIKGKKALINTSRVEFLHSGSHTLNLALCGKARNGGWARGRINNIVGDGSSGKTICALELCFWCHKNIEKITSKIFGKTQNVFIVYNNCEGVMDFPLIQIYGEKFVDSVEWICTNTVEKMGRDYTRRVSELKKGDFLLYIVDSWDALLSSAEEKRFKESIETDKDMSSSFDLEKQKFTGRFFANTCKTLEKNETDATMFIVSQVRQKIGITFGKKTYRAGGKALDFYTHLVAWIAEQEKLAKTKLKSKRTYGIISKIKVERSKVAKPFREGAFKILFDYGIDDIGSMLDFVYGKGTIEFNNQRFRDQKDAVKYIEEKKEREDLLIDLAQEAWDKIEREFEKEIKARKARF